MSSILFLSFTFFFVVFIVTDNVTGIVSFGIKVASIEKLSCLLYYGARCHCVQVQCVQVQCVRVQCVRLLCVRLLCVRLLCVRLLCVRLLRVRLLRARLFRARLFRARLLRARLLNINVVMNIKAPQPEMSSHFLNLFSHCRMRFIFIFSPIKHKTPRHETGFPA